MPSVDRLSPVRVPFFHGGVQSLGLVGFLLLIQLTSAPSCFFGTASAEEFLLVFTCRKEEGLPALEVWICILVVMILDLK